MADSQEYVVTPERIVDEELGRVVYSPGARVPMADAVKYGLVDKAKATKAKAEPAKARPKGKRKPAEDRARKRAEDR